MERLLDIVRWARNVAVLDFGTRGRYGQTAKASELIWVTARTVF